MPQQGEALNGNISVDAVRRATADVRKEAAEIVELCAAYGKPASRRPNSSVKASLLAAHGGASKARPHRPSGRAGSNHPQATVPLRPRDDRGRDRREEHPATTDAPDADMHVVDLTEMFPRDESDCCLLGRIVFDVQ